MTSQTKLAQIPDTYILITGPDGIPIILPRFMVPYMEQELDSLVKKEEMKVVHAKSLTLRNEKAEPATVISGMVHVPPDLVLTHQERLTLHAEIIALQDRLGISYQDAAYRLYMTELEKLKVADSNFKFHTHLDRCVTKSLEEVAERHGVSETNK